MNSMLQIAQEPTGPISHVDLVALNDRFNRLSYILSSRYIQDITGHSKLTPRVLSGIKLLLNPSIALIALLPVMFYVTELLLHILYRTLIARVLAHVVAEFDGRTAGRTGDLDDDIKWLGFFAVGFVQEVI